MKIEHFYFNKKDLLLFFSCVVIFAILFILLYSPIEAVGVSGGMVGSWTQGAYLTLLVVVGFSMVGVSRVYMYLSFKDKRFSMWDYCGWVLVEVLVISFLLSLLSYYIRPKGEVSYWHLAPRVLVDVVSVLLVPYVLATLMVVLRHQRQRIEYLTELSKMSSLAAAPAAVDDGDQSFNFYDKSGRFAFATRKSNVLYVESADNYCNIHYINDGKLDRFILRNSMTNVCADFAERGFVRCHRSYLVNTQCIKSAKKTSRGIALEIKGTDVVIPVTKTYVSDVMKYLSES